MDGFDWALRRLEALAARMELMHLDAFLRHVSDWKRRLAMDFLSGIVRGVGFSIGFTLIGATILFVLRNAATANLPIIGRFLAELVRIVETNLNLQ